MSSGKPIDEDILHALHLSREPIAALQISKSIGLSTAKDANPTLYSLEKRGLIRKSTANKKVVWQIIQNAQQTTMPSIQCNFQATRSETIENPSDLIASDDNSGPSSKHIKLEKEANTTMYTDDIDMVPVQEEDPPEKEHHYDTQSSFAIPKPPHEMLKPSGHRSGLLANALYGKSSKEFRGHQGSSRQVGYHEMPTQEHSPYESYRHKESYSESPRQSYQEYHQPHFQSGSPFGESYSADPRLTDKILAFLSEFNRPVSTLEIAKAVNRRSKSEINPILYEMQGQGLITKTSFQPPAWKLGAKRASDADHMQHANPMPQMHQWQRYGGNHRNAFDASREHQQHPESETEMPSISSQTWNEANNRRSSRQMSWPPSDRNASFDVNESQMISHTSQAPVKQRTDIPKELSGITFAALNRNPISAINEYAQRNQMQISFELLHEGKGGPNRFLVAVKLNGKMYDAVSAANMKDARREAADVALREILSKDSSSILETNARISSRSNLTHFDKIAALSHQTFIKLSSQVQEKFAGRKVIAALIKKTYEDENGVVVSVGAGNRCITGDRLHLEGKTVNDSHAEIICRRAFLLYLYSELDNFYSNEDSIFEEGGIDGKLQVKDGITWHLYISTAPCGDAALFSPRESNSIGSNHSREHIPLFTSKQQGLLRTKIEDGEGTIPIDPNDGPQTWDGIVQGKRLRTMSCTDKICRWNVLGMQGALLSHLIEPIYLDSLTLGYLYEHGHLSRAICCRLSKVSNIDDELPIPFSLNHPWIGRVSVYDPPRATEKTNNLSINWYHGSQRVELTDGRTGACLTRTANAPTPSQLCKAELYKRFKEVCLKTTHLKQLAEFETYREAKEKAEAFQKAKEVMVTQFRRSKFGSWVKKPRELELF